MKTKLILILLLVFMSALPVVAQEDAIPSPDFTVLMDGESVQGELDISTINSALIYTFQAVEGDTVTISMVAEDTELLDPYLILYGPSGQVLAINDDVDYTRDNFNATIDDFEIEETGFHFVIATTSDLIYELTYEFGVNATINDGKQDMQAFDIVVKGNTQPDELSVPKFIIVESGDSVEVEISDEMAVRFVIFEAAAGSNVTLSAVSDDLDTLLYLFAPDGRQLAINDDMDFTSGISDSGIADFTVEDDGVYLAVVAVFDHLTPLTVGEELEDVGMVTVAVTVE